MALMKKEMDRLIIGKRYVDGKIDSEREREREREREKRVYFLSRKFL